MSFVATLIANPKNPLVTPDLAKVVSSAISSRNTYWLADGIACDIVLPQTGNPASMESQIRDIIGQISVDVVVQNQDTRRRKALIADMDSTMIEQECIDELAAVVGLKQEVSAITARAMNGEIPFEPALIERVALLKGLPIDIITQVLETRITLTPGGRELVTTMKAYGAHTSLVSGGFTHFTEKVAALLGFDLNQANILLEKDGVLTGEVARPILGKQAKVEALNQIAEAQGIIAEDFIAVGDGANDLAMLHEAGTGIALHAKPTVAAEAKIRIDHGDLTALLYLQGYRKSEFVV
jgi:phosphoserine phosphatase